MKKLLIILLVAVVMFSGCIGEKEVYKIDRLYANDIEILSIEWDSDSTYYNNAKMTFAVNVQAPLEQQTCYVETWTSPVGLQGQEILVGDGKTQAGKSFSSAGTYVIWGDTVDTTEYSHYQFKLMCNGELIESTNSISGNPKID